MGKGRKRFRGDDGLVTASELACFAYCSEQWRLQFGLGLEPGNRAVLDAGTRHHGRKAGAERLAGGLVSLGRVLAILALLGLLVLLLTAW